MTDPRDLKIEVELPFPTTRVAEIVYDVLRVDQEPKRSGVTKIVERENTNIKIKYQASLARQLRVALNNLFEKVDLIVQTIQEVGPPGSLSYDHY